MPVQEVDPRTAPDETLLAVHAIEAACASEVAPGEPLRSAEDAIGFYRHSPAGLNRAVWLGEGGYASLAVHGPSATFLDLLVAPGSRRRGVGIALANAVLERCRELGVAQLHADTFTPEGVAFARRFGAVEGERLVNSLLDLRTADLPEVEPPAGWRLVTWLDHVPEEHLAAYADARVAMDDAPAPEGMEFPVWDAEKIRASEASLRARGREMRLTVAMRDDGEIGSFTELRLSRGSTSGFTDDTGTVAAHRRLGLARVVKLESLRRLRADHPEVEVVTTSNDETNEPMLRVNRSVGFRPTSVVTQMVLRL